MRRALTTFERGTHYESHRKNISNSSNKQTRLWGLKDNTAVKHTSLTNQFLVPILGSTKLPKSSVPGYMTPFSEFCIFKHVVHIQIFRVNCTHKINKTNNMFL